MEGYWDGGRILVTQVMEVHIFLFCVRVSFIKPTTVTNHILCSFYSCNNNPPSQCLLMVDVVGQGNDIILV